MNILHLVPPDPCPVDETLIPVLEELLAMAKRGELAAVSYAAILRDGAMQTAMSPPHQHAFAMLGALERLKLRFYALHIEEPGE